MFLRTILKSLFCHRNWCLGPSNIETKIKSIAKQPHVVRTGAHINHDLKAKFQGGSDQGLFYINGWAKVSANERIHYISKDFSDWLKRCSAVGRKWPQDNFSCQIDNPILFLMMKKLMHISQGRKWQWTCQALVCVNLIFSVWLSKREYHMGCVMSFRSNGRPGVKCKCMNTY